MNIKALLPHGIAVCLFFLLTLVFFTPAYQGKTLPQGDITNYRGAAHEMIEVRETTGERPLWTGTMFGGMPNYQVSNVTDGNLLKYAHRAFRGWFMPGPAGFFFSGMVSLYLLFILCGISPWLAMAGAVGAAFATNNIVLYGAGHTSKVQVVFYLPLLMAGILLAFRTKYVTGGLLFALGMGLAIYSNHPQMVYYFGLTLPFFGIAAGVQAFRKGKLKQFGLATAVLVAGAVLAVGAGASNLLSTKDYLPASTRGGAVLTESATPGRAVAEGGLEWDYAMQWSNGFKDMVATYAPLAAGGGSGELIQRDSELGKAFRTMGANIRAEFNAPTYHGSLPFTEGPIYLGAVVWALFLFGLFTAPIQLRIWLGLGTLLIFIMSMGNNVEGFNHFLFDNLPLLKNFRSPNSALSVSTFMMAALGIFGVHKWMTQPDRDKRRKQLLYAGAASAALGVFVAILLPLFIDFNSAADATNLARMTGGQVPPAILDGMVDTRADLYAADAWRSFLFVGLTYGVLFLLFTDRLKMTFAALAIGALLLVDFAGINARYLSKSEFTTPRNLLTAFDKTPADETILADPDPHFRVLNLTRPLDQDAITSYYHKSLGGYSAVKMRRYQDLIEGYVGPRNRDVINMLNAKYFIAPGADGGVQAQRNPDNFGAAWLATSVKRVASDDAEFRALGETPDLRGTAIIHEEWSDAIPRTDFSGQGSIELTEYTPDRLTYSFSSDSDQLAVFSEMWYGPDKGWTVTIDGTPAPLVRANYVLRAVPVPAGQHSIVMSFAPASFALGRTLGLLCSLIILLGLVAYGTYRFLQRRRVDNTVTPTAHVE